MAGNLLINGAISFASWRYKSLKRYVETVAFLKLSHTTGTTSFLPFCCLCRYWLRNPPRLHQHRFLVNILYVSPSRAFVQRTDYSYTASWIATPYYSSTTGANEWHSKTSQHNTLCFSPNTLWMRTLHQHTPLPLRLPVLRLLSTHNLTRKKYL